MGVVVGMGEGGADERVGRGRGRRGRGRAKAQGPRSLGGAARLWLCVWLWLWRWGRWARGVALSRGGVVSVLLAASVGNLVLLGVGLGRLEGGLARGGANFPGGALRGVSWDAGWRDGDSGGGGGGAREAEAGAGVGRGRALGGGEGERLRRNPHTDLVSEWDASVAAHAGGLQLWMVAGDGVLHVAHADAAHAVSGEGLGGSRGGTRAGVAAVWRNRAGPVAAVGHARAGVGGGPEDVPASRALGDKPALRFTRSATLEVRDNVAALAREGATWLVVFAVDARLQRRCAGAGAGAGAAGGGAAADEEEEGEKNLGVPCDVVVSVAQAGGGGWYLSAGGSRPGVTLVAADGSVRDRVRLPRLVADGRAHAVEVHDEGGRVCLRVDGSIRAVCGWTGSLLRDAPAVVAVIGGLAPGLGLGKASSEVSVWNRTTATDSLMPGFKGDIAEVIAVGGMAGSTARAQATTYLADRYAILIPSKKSRSHVGRSPRTAPFQEAEWRSSSGRERAALTACLELVERSVSYIACQRNQEEERRQRGGRTRGREEASSILARSCQKITKEMQASGERLRRECAVHEKERRLSLYATGSGHVDGVSYQQSVDGPNALAGVFRRTRSVLLPAWAEGPSPSPVPACGGALPPIQLEDSGGVSSDLVAVVSAWGRTRLLSHTLKELARSKHVKDIYVVWSRPDLPALHPRFFESVMLESDAREHPRVHVLRGHVDAGPASSFADTGEGGGEVASSYWQGMMRGSLNHRFLPLPSEGRKAAHLRPGEIQGVFVMDDDMHIAAEDLDFAFRIWQQFPDKLVGFHPRTHHKRDGGETRPRSGAEFNLNNLTLTYNESDSDVSMLLTKQLLLAEGYLHRYSCQMPHRVRELVDDANNCEDLAMNFLVNVYSPGPPILVNAAPVFDYGFHSGLGSRAKGDLLSPSPIRAASSERFAAASHAEARHICLSEFSRMFDLQPEKVDVSVSRGTILRRHTATRIENRPGVLTFDEIGADDVQRINAVMAAANLKGHSDSILLAGVARAKLAFATLVASENYVYAALVWADAVRSFAAHSGHPLLCLVPSGDPARGVSTTAIGALAAAFDHVIPVGPVPNPYGVAGYLKVRLWQLTEFSKIVYLDADALVLSDLTSLFVATSSFAAAPDVGASNIFNSGLLVLRPNLPLFTALMSAAADTKSSNLGDQGFFNAFFPHWHTSSTANGLTRIPSSYNLLYHLPVCPSPPCVGHELYAPPEWHVQVEVLGESGGTNSNRLVNATGVGGMGDVHVVHFANPWSKPWRVSPAEADGLQQLWWCHYGRVLESLNTCTGDDGCEAEREAALDVCPQDETVMRQLIRGTLRMHAVVEGALTQPNSLRGRRDKLDGGGKRVVSGTTSWRLSLTDGLSAARNATILSRYQAALGVANTSCAVATLIIPGAERGAEDAEDGVLSGMVWAEGMRRPGFLPEGVSLIALVADEGRGDAAVSHAVERLQSTSSFTSVHVAPVPANPTSSPTYALLQAWGLAPHGRVVLTRPTVLFHRRDVVQDLCSLPATFAAIPSTAPPDALDTAILVLQPDRRVHADLVGLARAVPSFDGKVRGFLNAAFPEWFFMPPSTSHVAPANAASHTFRYRSVARFGSPLRGSQWGGGRYGSPESPILEAPWRDSRKVLDVYGAPLAALWAALYRCALRKEATRSGPATCDGGEAGWPDIFPADNLHDMPAEAMRKAAADEGNDAASHHGDRAAGASIPAPTGLSPEATEWRAFLRAERQAREAEGWTDTRSGGLSGLAAARILETKRRATEGRGVAAPPPPSISQAANARAAMHAQRERLAGRLGQQTARLHDKAGDQARQRLASMKRSPDRA